MATTMERSEQLAAQQLLSSWIGSTNTFDVPNLDGCDEADLLAYEMLFNTLGTYAQLKREAAIKRVRGLLDGETGALALERYCKTLYRRLPTWAKW